LNQLEFYFNLNAIESERELTMVVMFCLGSRQKCWMIGRVMGYNSVSRHLKNDPSQRLL